ncbi:acyl-CoA carboxylase subunit epsilon [Amycolatopsis magusensis]|uniref:acyl-CoA carboxylase subunit epsilon n=1 Tax=Amycolatopsis magusensis TaxID=882444 RepID=UPI003C2F8AC8
MSENRPLLRVVRGTPEDDELAALAAVIAAAASAGESSPASQPRRSCWADRAGALRQPLQPGPGAWRASSLPR